MLANLGALSLSGEGGVREARGTGGSRMLQAAAETYRPDFPLEGKSEGRNRLGWKSENESSEAVLSGEGSVRDARGTSRNRVGWQSENESSPAVLLATFFEYYAQVRGHVRV